MAVAGVLVALEALPLVRVHDYEHHEDDYDDHHDNNHDNGHDDRDSVDDNHNYEGDNCVVLLPSNSTTTTKSAFLTLQVLVLVMAVRCSHHLVRLGLKTLERPGLLLGVAGMRAMAMMGHTTVITGTQSTDTVPVDGTMTTAGMMTGKVIDIVMGGGGRITGSMALSTMRSTSNTTITGMEEVVRESADHIREGKQSTLFTIPM